jgi:hypothetical protein
MRIADGTIEYKSKPTKVEVKVYLKSSPFWQPQALIHFILFLTHITHYTNSQHNMNQPKLMTRREEITDTE